MENFENRLKQAVYDPNTKLFHSNTLSYFQDEGRIFEGKIGTLECQLAHFSWLSYPDVGIFGCPFSAGQFFTNRMQSNRLGVWLCVAERHHYSKESGEILAYFCGYRNDCHFYDQADLNVLLKNYKKLGLKLSNHYTESTEL